MYYQGVMKCMIMHEDVIRALLIPLPLRVSTVLQPTLTPTKVGISWFKETAAGDVNHILDLTGDFNFYRPGFQS
jgi:hypothetical protein